MSEVKKGRELTFKWNEAKVGKLLSASISVDGNTIDISNDDSGDWDEFLAGRKNWTMSLTAITDEHVTDSTQADMTADFVDQNDSGTVKFAPDEPQTGDVVYSGDAYVTNFSIDRGDSDDRVESSWELQGSGALSRAVTTTV